MKEQMREGGEATRYDEMISLVSEIFGREDFC